MPTKASTAAVRDLLASSSLRCFVQSELMTWLAMVSFQPSDIDPPISLCLPFPVLLAAMCGLRRGEIAALRWRNVDLDKATLSVVQSAEQTRAGVRYTEPKRGRSRNVSLSANVVDELRSWRVQQAEEMLRLGIRPTSNTLICTTAAGEGIQPNSLTHEWLKSIEGTGLPRIRFHDLRHSHATHMLASGVHVKVASERLGHSKIGITLDLYSHVLPGMQEDAVAKVDAAFKAHQKP